MASNLLFFCILVSPWREANLVRVFTELRRFIQGIAAKL